MSYICGLHLWW